MITFKLTQKQWNIWFTTSALMVVILLFTGAILPLKIEYTTEDVLLRTIICGALILSTISTLLTLIVGQQEIRD